MERANEKQTTEPQQEQPEGVMPEGPPHIIGIGASAGGVQALQTFFGATPADTGAVFVIVMHLSPDHDSNLVQVLQQRTAMPVVSVTENVRVEPNHVYVIPPNKHLTIEHSTLHLVSPQQPTGRRVAVDLFFRTLASACGPLAVAVVLSGSDSDGVIGIKHAKEQGGLTIAQDPNEADFDGMPRGAISTGMVDWVLPVAQIPGRIVEFLHNERHIHMPPEEPAGSTEEVKETNSGGPVPVQQIPSSPDEAALGNVLMYLHTQTGHDFDHYKRATILRRIARRMQVNLLETLSAYLDFLRTHPAEVIALFQDLLISVTNFFRDKDAFCALESYIPQLFADKSASNQVRVWTVGCATGEEAYSVAILLLEYAGRLDSPPSIQIFATDLDEGSIQIARAGIYPPTIEADVSAERLRRFFQKVHGQYRIKQDVRELVLFSTHDVLKDAPFSHLDLITCRNMLIYLKREAQDGILPIFHFALRPSGLLFLGGSETVEDANGMFAPLDKHFRIYVRRSLPRPKWRLPVLPVPTTGTLPPALRPRPPRPPGPAVADVASDPQLSPAASDRRAPLFGDLHLALLEAFAPPSVIVDDNHDILHLSENVSRYLTFAGGDASTNLLKVVRPELRPELRSALFRSEKGEPRVTIAHVPLETNGKRSMVNLHVCAVKKPELAEGLTLVVFEPVAQDEDGAGQPSSAAIMLDQHISEENAHLREQLNVTVEQYETSLEETKATNEELQAINEEMRSTTEELETSKEELQSINEELTTVNQQLKTSVDELSRANSDLQNLMASTEIGTIFLDRQLKIKRFTPAAQRLFNLIDTDVGRPLSDITHRLNYANLKEDAQRLLRDLRVSEREVHSDGRWYLGRILPYRTVDDHIDGVVLTFVDITERKQHESERITLERETALWKERNRVGQELHDTLAQAFTSIQLQLDTALETLQSDPAAGRLSVQRAREISIDSLQETRRAVRALRAGDIETGGLQAGLEKMVAQIAPGASAAVRFVVEGTPCPLADRAESELFRIAQEAVTNALRHARAHDVAVTLSYQPTCVRLRIADDGRGFDINGPVLGLGLSGMQARAERAGGSLAVSSEPGKGTEISVMVPLTPPATIAKGTPDR